MICQKGELRGGDHIGGHQVQALLKKFGRQHALTIGDQIALGVDKDGEGEGVDAVGGDGLVVYVVVHREGKALFCQVAFCLSRVSFMAAPTLTSTKWIWSPYCS